MSRLLNKVIIITGAAGGMGASMAKLFAQEGASIMATDLLEDKLNEWVQIAKKEGLNLECIKHDVSNGNDWDKVISKTVSIFGKIDGLVNNAGIYPGFYDCENTSEELWNKVIGTNLTGPFLGCKKVIPYLRKNGGGSILNIASIAGLIGGNGVAYSSSKGGLVLLTKDLAVSLAKDNIRVNAICPGGVKTPMTDALLGMPGMDEVIKNMSPQGRMAEAIEIANGAIFLISDESSFVTGAELVIDGGSVAR